MANTKISALSAAGALAGTEVAPIVQSAATVKATVQAIANLALTSGATGTLPVNKGGTGVTASTGTVAVVLSTSPTLVTPVLGSATGTSLAMTAPADPSVSMLTLTGGSALTTSQPIINATQTWVTAGTTYTGVKYNVTDTASAAASLLLDLQVGTTTKFNVDKAGALTLTADLILRRSAAATLSFGAADAASPVAQNIAVQNVVAGTSNTAGAAFTINGSRGTGTGVGGSIIFQTAPAGSTGSSQNALVTALTLSGTTGEATFVHNITLPGARLIVFTSRIVLATTTNGNLRLTNASQNDFGLLQLGGTTSSFPAIKRSGVLIAVRLADDSADAGLTALYVKSAATTVAGLTAAATAGAGARGFVTDANATTFLSTVAGGGANAVPVVSDGTNWLIG